jgi:hypothetical protein
MKMDNRFATRAKTVDEIPEPFQRPLRKLITPEESVSLLVHAPAYKSLANFPATVLAITDQQWLLIEETSDGNAIVNEAAFEETLLVELTEILLFGQLKIDYAADGDARSSAVHFNSAMDKLYHEAAHLLLNGISGLSSAFDREATSPWPPADWPVKFRNDISKIVPQGARLVECTYWPAVNAGFRRELAPAAGLVLTENEIILAADPPAGHLFVPRDDNKYGRVATYFPLVRLGQHRIIEHEKFNILELETHASHGSERLQIIFPSSHMSQVSDLMDRVFAAVG